jgi:catechol 2,3-dioxygenase-like lactoylglutathione lyase family enzyme
MMTKVKEVAPVLPVRDIQSAVKFYGKLGFQLAFEDQSKPRRYAGVRRDGVGIHLQWHSQAEFEHCRASVGMLRLMVDDPDALYGEYSSKGLLDKNKQILNTGWGTREFGLFDPDGNGLTFYAASTGAPNP